MKKIHVYAQPDTLNDRTILKLLLDNPIFILTIHIARDVLGLPTDGLSLQNIIKTDSGNYDFKVSTSDKKVLDSLYKGLKSFMRLWANVSNVCSSFHTSSRWFGPIQDIILFNVVLRKPKPSVRLGFGSHISSLLKLGPEFIETPQGEKSDRTLIIEISEKMTIPQLKQYIDDLDRESKVTTMLNALSGPPTKPDISKVKNIEIKSEMRNLKREGKSYSEIRQIIESKYRDNLSFQINNQSISRYLDRYNKDSLGLIDKEGNFLNLYKEVVNKKTKK